MKESGELEIKDDRGKIHTEKFSWISSRKVVGLFQSTCVLSSNMIRSSAHNLREGSTHGKYGFKTKLTPTSEC